MDLDLRVTWRVILAGLLVAAVLALFAVSRIGTASEVAGIILPAAGAQSKRVAGSRMWVQLDSGKIVASSVPLNEVAQPGRRVVLTETRTLLFGWPRYHFLRYQ